ncbi:proteoglycan 4-like [Macrobrachium rosenbergii]|uniref:proteoglycan 4-like n=1 Tax=Macrobrachium rosenbergii TaxID=79674 RepID=UPI0034D4B55D
MPGASAFFLILLGTGLYPIREAYAEENEEIETYIAKEDENEDLQRIYDPFPKCLDTGCAEHTGGQCGNWSKNEPCLFRLHDDNLCSSLMKPECSCCIPCMGRCENGGMCRDKCNPHEQEDPESTCGESCKCCIPKNTCEGDCSEGGTCRADVCLPNEEEVPGKCPSKGCICCLKKPCTEGPCGKGGVCRDECIFPEYKHPFFMCPAGNCKCCYTASASRCGDPCGGIAGGTCKERCDHDEEKLLQGCGGKECSCCKKKHSCQGRCGRGHSFNCSNSCPPDRRVKGYCHGSNCTCCDLNNSTITTTVTAHSTDTTPTSIEYSATREHKYPPATENDYDSATENEYSTVTSDENPSTTESEHTVSRGNEHSTKAENGHSSTPRTSGNEDSTTKGNESPTTTGNEFFTTWIHIHPTTGNDDSTTTENESPTTTGNEFFTTWIHIHPTTTGNEDSTTTEN